MIFNKNFKVNRAFSELIENLRYHNSKLASACIPGFGLFLPLSQEFYLLLASLLPPALRGFVRF
jgi:hypothetical protein